MPQGQALELCFDRASEERVARSIGPTPGGESILELGARPHISLALFVPPVDEQELVDIAEAVAGGVRRFSLFLSAVAVFPGEEGVVFLAPSIVPELTAAHRQAHDLIARAGLPTDARYRSDRWVPHCTVLMGVPDRLIGSQVETLRNSEACGWVDVVAVRVIAFRPVVEIAHFDLGG